MDDYYINHDLQEMNRINEWVINVQDAVVEQSGNMSRSILKEF